LSHNSFDALTPFGWSARVHALYHEVATTETVPGRVVRVERSACVVTVPDRELLATARWLPAVGDWVAVTATDDRGLIRGVLPRWSELVREDPHGDRPQTLAANADLVLITTPADRPSPARVERESLVAWESGARPVVVVPKSDVDNDGYADELSHRLVAVDVLATSAVTGDGIDAVAELLRPNLTAVLLGPSGAGKSTLANALLGGEVLATGAVRTTDQRGRHTTTSRQLVAIPGGGVLIDTPGIRSLGMWADGDGIQQTFPDITELAATCRFADCRHQQEPGCAVLAAAATGTLDADRFASYRKLERELAYEHRRTDPLARADEQRRWKSIQKEQRRRYRASGKS
jgi:ribosome biogenesis GTPase